MLVRLTALCAIALPHLSACSAPPPTAEQLESAQIGAKPETEIAQVAARWVLDRLLYDPKTALIEFPAPISRGYFQKSVTQREFAWTLVARVQDRDPSGGFRNELLFEFYFRDDNLITYSSTAQGAFGSASATRQSGEPVPLETFRRGEIPVWIDTWREG